MQAKNTFKIIILSCFMLCVGFSAFMAQAQERQKPKLVEIVVNSETNDQTALETAQNLDPVFFDVADEDKKDINFYARFLSLDENNKDNFLVLTAEDSNNFYCTAYGCPYYIYRKDTGNRWSLVLSFQAYSFYNDLITSGNSADNLISISTDKGKRALSVWAWNGVTYQKINK